jgi:uncharacterized damage-inducible protein DinB
MTPDDLRSLVDYHYWATYRLLDAVEPLDADRFTRDLHSSFPSVRDTLSHLHSAEWIWLSRLRGHSPTAFLPHDRFREPADARRAWRETEADMRDYVAAADDARLAAILGYRLLNGQPGATPVGKVLQHVVNHGTYHRGQVTTMLRQLGAAAGKPQDLIAFYRELAV